MAASAQEKELAQLIVTSLNLEVSADEIEPEAPNTHTAELGGKMVVMAAK